MIRSVTMANFLFTVLLPCYVLGCFASWRNHDQKTQVAPLDRISVKGKWLVDTLGRVRLFHGTNSVYKGPPWYKEEMVNATKLQYFKEWGFNAIRLGAMWGGFEPTEGAFNATYTNVIKKILASLERRGMYAILDMHQDVMSSRFGEYDAFPKWMVDKLPPPRHPFPWPFDEKITSWGNSYLTEAVGQAFQCFYDNTQGAQDYLVRFWEYVAKNFKELNNVLGYELMNEPWAGDIYYSPKFLLPGEAGKKNLLPLYDVINERIRAIDKETLVFYEPVTWGVWLEGKQLGSGFDRVPGGEAYRNKSVLSYHYYCWAFQVSDNNKTASFFKRAICDKLLGPEVYRAIDTDVSVTGGSSFLTEFGLCEPDGNKNSTGSVECAFVMDHADKHLQSWTYWDDAFFHGSGDVNWPTAYAFARPYAQATAGIPLIMNFNSDDSTFHFQFCPDASITAPTVIFVPKLRYPKGFQVTLTPGYSWTYDQMKFVVNIVKDERYVAANDSQNKKAARDSTVDVHITPK